MSGDKKSYIDHQSLSKGFKEGDSVLFPIFTRGNRFAPHYGEVVCVLSSIGMLDVATPMGTIRVEPHEVIKDDSQNTGHLEDTGYDSWDKRKHREASAEDFPDVYPRKVACRYFNRRIRPIMKSVTENMKTASSDMELYNSVFREMSGPYSDEEIKTAINRTKEAVYWKDKGRQYIPTQKEWESGEFHCPRCKNVLRKAKYKKDSKLYVCDECLWMICPEDLIDRDELNEEQEEELEEDKQDDGAVDFFEAKDPLLKEMID
jgi:predicted RNA-binding Zn-ribbon protein involved in translation (DUF1610 family)